MRATKRMVNAHMGMILANEAARLFEEIIGWPYVSPGTNDERGIDCSGAWVRVYKEFGMRIDHGSNSIYRKFCGQVGAITSASQLQVGMAVFKHRDDGNEPSKYYGDGIGNMYHVGCVTSVNPLRIVHATSPVAKVDTSLGKWSHFGLLKDVDYGSIEAATPSVSAPAEIPQEATTPPNGPRPGQAIVSTKDTGLNLRKLPSTKGAPIKEMPKGAIIDVLRVEGTWANVRYVDARGMTHVGWCAVEYLTMG